MFKLSRVIQISKPLLKPYFSSYKQSALVFKNILYFTQEIKNQIFEFLKAGKIQQNLDKISIDLAYLNEQRRYEVLEQIVGNVQAGRQPSTILMHQKFNIQLQKHPDLFFDAKFFLLVQSINQFSKYIQGKDMKLKKTMNKQISQTFIICFQLLKKIEAKITVPKEIHLLRTFANYNYFYLAKLVDPLREHQCIKKARQNYKLTLSKCSALLKCIVKDEEEQTVNKNIPKQKPQQRQKRLTELRREFDQLKFDVAQRYGQVVFQILNIEDQEYEKNKIKQMQLKQLQANKKKSIKKQRSQEIQFQMGKQTLALQPFILQGIKNFDLIADRMIESKCYYKLRKLQLQVGNQIKMRKFVDSTRNKKQIQKEKQLQKIELQIKNDMDSFYDQALKKLKETKSQQADPNALAEHFMVILSTKIHQFFVDSENYTTINQKEIAKQIQNILNYIPDQTNRKKILALLFLKVKSTFNIKIDSYFQKVPRNFRTQRRKKVQQY